MTTRFKELTSATALAVSLADAKAALRVVDSGSIATKANRSVGSGNSQLLVIAKVAGSIGNQYSMRVVVSGNNTALSVTYVNNLLTINSATNGSAAATSSVNDVIAAIYANADAAAIFDATAGSGNGTGTIGAAGSANLSAGVDSGDEDAYLTFLIQATTEVIEASTAKALITRTFAAYFDEWPDCDDIDLPVNPVASVEHVYYRDQNASEVDFLASLILDNVDDQLPARLVKKYAAVFPILDFDATNAVRIEFTAGYGATSDTIPAKIRQCILFLVAHWYQSREPVVNGTAVLSNKVPFTFETVLNSFRLITV